MKLIHRLLLAAILLIFTATPLLAQTNDAFDNKPNTEPSTAAFIERLAKPDLISRLRKGGYILYIRHGNTDNSNSDNFPFVDLNDCSTQRLLSDQGRKLMKQVGQSIRNAKLPIGEIFVSPMCRTKESAQLAFGDKFTVSELLIVSANMTSSEKKPLTDELKKLLSKPVARGTNRVILSHAPNLADLIGLFVKPEGSVIVFEHDDSSGYKYIASIPPSLWKSLIK